MSVSLCMEDSLPVGYRFRPTDEELINHYLKLKINGDEKKVSVIREIDVCKCEPWDLPDKSAIKSADEEWFFFCPKDRKYQNGQRLNRATVAGYWKATGKDRSIKSLRGTTLIGMKKTLVFYEGRAPNGQRTNWVIHEYRATSKDLDGTKPGQGSFVLCKLMKKHDEKLKGKQDEITEVLNCDETEENVSSPATVKSVVEDMQSEPETPMTGTKAQKQPSSSESFLPTISDSTSIDAPVPINWPNDSNVADDAGDTAIIQPDFELEEMLRMFDDPISEPPDGEGKIFSPLHMQMKQFGSPYDFQYPGASDMGHGHRGLPYQYGTNEQDITEFLDSVLVSSDESEAPNYDNLMEAQFDPGFEGYGQFGQNIEEAPVYNREMGVGNFVYSPEESSSNVVGNDDIIGTGIRIRTRQFHNRPSAENSGLQGTAPRRIRLQKKLQVGPLYCSNVSYGLINHEIVAKAEEAEEEHAATIGAADIVGGIQDMTLSEYSNDTKVTPKPSLNKKSGSYFPFSGDKDAPPTAALKMTPARRLISSSVYMFKALFFVVVCLSIAYIGVWRCLKF